MKVKINYPNTQGGKATLQAHLDRFSNFRLDNAAVESRLIMGAEKARELTNAGSDYLVQAIGSNKNKWMENFNRDATLVEWFGIVKNKQQVQKVVNRMEGLRKRMNRTLTIRVRPFPKSQIKKIDAGEGFTLAKTVGAINLRSGTFTVYPYLVTRGLWEVAETIVHEIGHQWFKDQKLESSTVYGETPARDLAKYNPRKARKSAENYSIYCDRVHPQMGYARRFVGSYSALS
jgi:hypothetical protein